MTSKIHHAKLRVEFEDCDAMGVVYHPNYLSFIERSRVEYLRAYGISFSSMLQSGAGMVIAELHALYWRPARFEDELHVYTRQVFYSEKRILIEQFIVQEPLSSDQQKMTFKKIPGRVFGATVSLTSVDITSLKSAPFPEMFAKVLIGLTTEVHE